MRHSTTTSQPAPIQGSQTINKISLLLQGVMVHFSEEERKQLSVYCRQLAKVGELAEQGCSDFELITDTELRCTDENDVDKFVMI